MKEKGLMHHLAENTKFHNFLSNLKQNVMDFRDTIA